LRDSLLTGSGGLSSQDECRHDYRCSLLPLFGDRAEHLMREAYKDVEFRPTSHDRLVVRPTLLLYNGSDFNCVKRDEATRENKTRVPKQLQFRSTKSGP
jgi:hypothetical protein